jgi:PIN domain nuclease of toxin-antitoxin system
LRVLLDTHILLWTALEDRRLSARATSILYDPANEIAFSVVAIWEVAIKHNLRRLDFPVPPDVLREAALAIGWNELPVLADHAIEVGRLPLIHGDPFDRLLVAQARCEGLSLLSADRMLWKYGHPVQRV